MIRAYNPADADSVVRVWLETSVAAHHFIAPAYWQSKANDMRDVYLPASQTYVWQAEDSDSILGFISLVDDFIAALFVLSAAQGKGIGTQLVSYVKQMHKRLGLAVYKENSAAVGFYKRQGFRVVGEGVDEQTGHTELTMVFEG